MTLHRQSLERHAAIDLVCTIAEHRQMKDRTEIGSLLFGSGLPDDLFEECDSLGLQLGSRERRH